MQAENAGFSRAGQAGAGDHEVVRLWRALLVASLVFVVYGSLVPLDFRPMPWSDAVVRFAAMSSSWADGGSSVDKASNILLTVPLAFCAAQWLLPGRSSFWVWCGRSLIFAGVFLVSLGVEFAQLFFPSRTSSWSDIQAQTLGTVLALVTQRIFGAQFSGWLAGWWHRERGAARLSRALKAYLAVLVGFSLLPLDLTVSPVELYHKWSEGRIILLPFGGLKGSLAERLYESLTDVVVWVPVGVFLRLSGPVASRNVLAHGLLAAAVIELLQLFVFSRVSDVTDVLLAGVGVSMGCAMVTGWGGWASHASENGSPMAWLFAWVFWLLMVLGVFWFPFDFRGVPDDGWTAWVRVPFATYQLSDEYRASNEALRRLGFFLPGGLLWGFFVAARKKRGRGTNGVARLLPLAWVPLLVEAGQVLLPGKVADLTDACLAFLGGWVGLRLALWLVAAPHVAQPEPLPHRWSAHGSLALSRVGAGSPRSHFLTIAGLCAASMLLVQMPGVPYNLKELVAVGPFGVVSAMALAISAYLMAYAPAMLFTKSALWVWLAPLAFPLTGVVAYGLLRSGVPLESIHDVVGAPVWDWPWEWELLLRFSALWTALSLPVGGACLLVATLLDSRRLPALLNAVLMSSLLAFPLYDLIVRRAATDNLTELMAHQASFAVALSLTMGLAGVCLVGSSLSALLVSPKHWRRLMPLALLGAVVAPIALVSGFEDTVVKYGHAFSALQFLLSSDRVHYVSGVALGVRLLVALGVMISALMLLQLPYWRQTARTVERLARSRVRTQDQK